MMNIFTIIRAIDEGLSKRQKIIIAILSVMFSIGFVVSAPESKHPKFLYILAGFCVLVFVACLAEGRAKDFFGSIIALIFFAISAFIVSSLPPSLTKETGILIAISIAMAIPSVKYLFKVQFGLKSTKKDQEDNA